MRVRSQLPFCSATAPIARTRTRLARAAALSLAAVLALGLGQSPAAAAGGGGIEVDGGGAPARTPKQIAAQLHKSGLRHRDKAHEYEEKHASAEAAGKAKQAAKWRKRADKEFRRAASDFEKAVRRDKTLFHAFNELGYAKRKLGKFEEALAAYDKALALEPRFGEAVEYRAEAYLALGRLDDAKTEYMRLFTASRPLAAQLMRAMQRFVDAPPAEPVLTASAQEAFAQWVAERQQLASQLEADREATDASAWSE